jgi:hypothetical protein
MATAGPVKRFTPQEIVGRLDSQFEKARESGDLLFFPSTVHKHTDVGVEVSFLHLAMLFAGSSQFLFWFHLPNSRCQ